MARYVKLGDRAESFYEPVSGFGLAGKEVKELKGSGNSVITGALKGGHLVFATEAEFIAAGGKVEVEEPAFTSRFGDDASELLAYYKRTYEVTKADVTAFKKLSLQEMVDELEKLESK